MESTSPKHIPLTVGILTHNSGTTLERALRSVEGVAEIILCDGSSTDDTRAIALRYGARVLEQAGEFRSPDGRLRDFSGVRNQILAASTQPWIFFLDSDEQATSELLSEFLEIIQANEPAAFFVLRHYVLEEREILYATTYPNKQMRFFKRDVVRKYIRPVHEKPVLNPDALVKTTRNYMLVPIGSLEGLLERWNRYIEIEASLRPSVPLSQWLRLVAHHAKVSCLYAFRLPGVLLKGRTSRLPIRYELARHTYHLMLIRRLWKNVHLN
jgi:glycosyltransferase involved in cell wall biosynthesis